VREGLAGRRASLVNIVHCAVQGNVPLAGYVADPVVADVETGYVAALEARGVRGER
jgi:hypothetical protein